MLEPQKYSWIITTSNRSSGDEEGVKAAYMRKEHKTKKNSIFNVSVVIKYELRVMQKYEQNMLLHHNKREGVLYLVQ